MMEWFTQWWLGLGLAGQIMACAAIPMSVIMLLQLVLMIIGLGSSGESDGDIDDGGLDDGGLDDGGLDDGSLDEGSFDEGSLGEGTTVMDSDQDHLASEVGSNTNANSIWRIFTIRGIVAFFALGGWAGLAALAAGVPVFWSIQIALFAGVAAMMLASIAIRMALRMQDSGNINIRNALAQTADVYITIPPLRTNTGKITMVLQERFVELEAVTDCEFEIRPNTKVEVVGLKGTDCLVVRPIEEESK